MSDVPSPKLYLDTNIFIAAFEAGNERVLPLFVGQPRHPGTYLFTSLLTRAEVLVHPYRDGNDRLIGVYENWTESNEILSVGPIEPETLRYAAVLRAQYNSVKLPDAIHLSTAIGFECTHFVSFDKHFEKMPTVTHMRYGMAKSINTPTYVNPANGQFLKLVERVLV